MKYYVYQFLNKKNEVIYIGKTQNLRRRLKNEHFTMNGHLGFFRYMEVEKVLAAELISHEEMDIYERYLINIKSPRYNKVMNNANSFSFQLPKLDWKEVPIDKDKLESQFHEKIIKELEDERIFKESSREKANITTEALEVSKKGYIVLRNNDTILLNLDIERTAGKNSRRYNTIPMDMRMYPYCRYIVVNNQRYFCIADIERVIHGEVDTFTQTRVLIQNKKITPRDIIILMDDTLYSREHVTARRALRFGNEEWLVKRILHELYLNKYHGKHVVDSGWTDELRYFANEILKEGRENLKKTEARKSGKDLIAPTKPRHIVCL